MLFRERVTVFTQLVSEEPYHLPPEFVFKGKGTRIKLDPPLGEHFQCAEKDSYRVENILETIKHLPNNYSVHCKEYIKNALSAKGYVPIIMGGGITGDMQINDTHLDCPLKSVYRERESLLMIEQLRADPPKIPSPNRNEMMVVLTMHRNQSILTLVKVLNLYLLETSLMGRKILWSPMQYSI